MLALAEVLWLPKDQKSWTGFTNRLQAHYSAFDQKGLTYCPGNYAVSFTPLAKNGQVSVAMTTEIPGAEIRYTTDGSEPSMQSAKYTNPVEVQTSMTVKASTAEYGRIRSREAATQQFSLHKAIGKPVDYTYPVSRYYAADGPNSLTDGIRGTYATGKYWHGFSGNDLVATIDLGSSMSFNSISLGCLHKYKDWIFLPQWVKFELSADGINYTELATMNNSQPISTGETIYGFTAASTGKAARYIRITAKNNLCPPGHPGEGKPGWIFADEVVVD
jgi:hexosaminidase